MRYTWFCPLILLATAMTTAAVAGAPAAAATVTTRSAKTPAHMGGLDPKALGKAEDIVRRRWEAVMRVLRDKKLDQAAKQAQVEDIVSPVFDFAGMTRLALGKNNWGKFTAAQREEFSKLFVKRLKESYGRRIADYGGEKVFFKPPLPLKTPKGRKPAKQPSGGPRIVHVPVEIVSESRRWTILHKFRRIGEVYRIYDVEIEGVSILKSYRSQFNDVLRRGSPEDLLARLRKSPNPPAKKGGKRT